MTLLKQYRLYHFMKIRILILSLFSLLSLSCANYQQMLEQNSSKNTYSEYQKEKIAKRIIYTRDWRQLYFMDVATLAQANVYNRYIQDIDRLFYSLDDSRLIHFIIKEWLVKYPSDEQAWNLVEFYMLYQSEKRPYFSLIFDILEENDLVTHPRAAIMLKYKEEMMQLRKSNKGFININMFNEIKARIKAQGVKHILPELSYEKHFKDLTANEKYKLAQLIVYSRDWANLGNYTENITSELILPFLKKKRPQYTDIFCKIIKEYDTRESWVFNFVIREYLVKCPSDEKAWDFIERYMPIYESETPYFTIIRDSLEECNLLNMPRAFIMSQYDEGYGDDDCGIKAFNDFYEDLKRTRKSRTK